MWRSGDRVLKRHDGRTIIHFVFCPPIEHDHLLSCTHFASHHRQLTTILVQDYDCFYAAVFESENPALKHLPLAVQQKQIIVTCNYQARRRGLYKLQLIQEAKRICPDVIIVLGEDLTRFRNASKDLYNFLKTYVWSQKAERLGFDEVFLDVTSMIEYNMDLLNKNDFSHSFFHLDKEDPTMGFAYDATSVCGHTYPKKLTASTAKSTDLGGSDGLMLRLHLGSHLAQHLRHQLEEQKGYTATVGISTSKLLSKLVGNVHKPNDQTTLMPPYTSDVEATNVTNFVDDHDIGKIPGIGFKLAQKIRSHVLGKAAKFDDGLVYGNTLENVKVGDVRLHPKMGPETLESILGGHGSPKGIGSKIWGLINGADDAEVGVARSVPRQISIEDSYIRLDTMEEVVKELRTLAQSLLKRMRLDLTETDEDDDQEPDKENSTDQEARARATCQWLAHPKTLRLTTRPRPPLNADGTRTRSFNRISRSGPMPVWIFNLDESIENLAERLVNEALIPSFRKLHPEKAGWNLSLVNVAATNMVESAADGKFGSGRDIGKMFRRQEDVLKPWKVEDRDVAPEEVNESVDVAFLERAKSVSEEVDSADDEVAVPTHHRSQPKIEAVSSPEDGSWESDEEYAEGGETCVACGATMPTFAMAAHQRFHLDPD